MRASVILFEWQEAVIRAAITLKLCSFEDTEPSSFRRAHAGRLQFPGGAGEWAQLGLPLLRWRDRPDFTVHALVALGATRTTSASSTMPTNVVAMERGSRLRPVYAIVPDQTIEERGIEASQASTGHGPVRIGNAAADQTQHDVYGSVILAASLMFFDERLPRKGDASLMQCWNRWARAR